MQWGLVGGKYLNRSGSTVIDSINSYHSLRDDSGSNTLVYIISNLHSHPLKKVGIEPVSSPARLQSLHSSLLCTAPGPKR